MSLSQLQEIPLSKTILLVGPPGAGKSTFCQQTVLQNLAVDKPVDLKKYKITIEE